MLFGAFVAGVGVIGDLVRFYTASVAEKIEPVPIHIFHRELALPRKTLDVRR
jgi:hypothetical protein